MANLDKFFDRVPRLQSCLRPQVAGLVRLHFTATAVNSGGIGTVFALLRHYWVPAAYCFNIGFMNTNTAFMLLMIISQSVNIAIYKPRAELRPKVFVVTK